MSRKLRLMKKTVRKWLYSLARVRYDLRLRMARSVHGRYRIERKLGSGSYGIAYLCRDIPTGRTFVLKWVNSLSGGNTRTAVIYQQEVGIMKRLSHPSVPPLHDAFQWKGLLFFTMDYVDGRSLDELLFRQQRRFTEHEALRIGAGILDIAADLHACGVVHRDISIANVMLSGESVRLIDFGLARELRSGGAASEPDIGEIDDDDPAEKKLRRAVHVSSDLYSVGHLLLFLLYSTFDNKQKPRSGEEQGWEEELSLHPETKRLLRRLLMADEPYADALQAKRAIMQALGALAD